MFLHLAKTNKIILVFFILVQLSCEEEAEITIPYPEKNLVVNCILDPNKYFEVHISESGYVLDTFIHYIDNANVKILSNNNIPETLEYDSAGFYRSINNKPISGKCYKLEVSTPIYNDVYATGCVTFPVRIDSVVRKADVGKNEFGKPYSGLTIFFKDPPDTENYYYLSFEVRNMDTLPPYANTVRFNYFSYSPIILTEGKNNSKIFSDKTFKSNKVVLPINYLEYKEHKLMDYRITVSLFSISKSYYLFQKKLSDYNEAMNDIFRVNNPPQMYSNVENAFGVFASIAISDSLTVFYKY
jgi:hypothetical protein